MKLRIIVIIIFSNIRYNLYIKYNGKLKFPDLSYKEPTSEYK